MAAKEERREDDTREWAGGQEPEVWAEGDAARVGGHKALFLPRPCGGFASAARVSQTGTQHGKFDGGSMSDSSSKTRGVVVFCWLVGLLGVAGVFAGCGGQTISAGETTVLVGQRTNGGDDALGGGTLEIVGGCLGASGSVIVWPHGTKVVDENPLTIDIPDKGTFSLGDQVEVPGGFVLEHPSDDVVAGPYKIGSITVPAQCAEHDVFVARRGD